MLFVLCQLVQFEIDFPLVFFLDLMIATTIVITVMISL